MDTVETLRGGFLLRSRPPVFPLSTDSMVLADFFRLRARARICDLGCGGGVLGLLLCGRSADCRVTGVELQPEACALAEENIARNGLSGRCSLLNGDLRKIRALLPSASFTDVISNPPYFTPDVPASPAPRRAAARTELTCTLDELCAAAAWLLSWGGRFTLVYRPERLCDLFCTLRQHRLEPKRIRFVRHRAGHPVSLALLEARLGGRPGLAYEPDLTLYGADGRPTAEFLRIYRQEGD